MNYCNNWNMNRQDNTIMCVLVPSSANFDNVTISPNQKIFVMSQSEPVFAIKCADAMGFVNTKYCRFEEFDPKATAQQQQMSIEQRLSRLEDIINGKSANEYDGKFAENEQPNS